MVVSALMAHLYERKGRRGKSRKGKKPSSPVELEEARSRDTKTVVLGEADALKEINPAVLAAAGLATSGRDYSWFRAVCRAHAGAAVEALVGALSATKFSESGFESADFPSRIRAAQVLIEHGFGKPIQAVAVASGQDASEGSEGVMKQLSNAELERVINVSLKVSAEDSADNE